MSLVSKITKLFSPLDSQVAPDEDPTLSSYPATASIEAAQLRSLHNARSNQQLSMEEEEEVRHPYIHVRHDNDDNDLWRSPLMPFTVHARRWIGRYLRGPTHALHRYRKNPTTRRSAHATQIYLSLLILYQNTPPRRYPSRPVQRCHPSIPWLFPWNTHLFRLLRV